MSSLHDFSVISRASLFLLSMELQSNTFFIHLSELAHEVHVCFYLFLFFLFNTQTSARYLLIPKTKFSCLIEILVCSSLVLISFSVLASFVIVKSILNDLSVAAIPYITFRSLIYLCVARYSVCVMLISSSFFEYLFSSYVSCSSDHPRLVCQCVSVFISTPLPDEAFFSGGVDLFYHPGNLHFNFVAHFDLDTLHSSFFICVRLLKPITVTPLWKIYYLAALCGSALFATTHFKSDVTGASFRPPWAFAFLR